MNDKIIKYIGFNVIENENKKLVKIEDIKKYQEMNKLKKNIRYRKLYGWYYIKFKNNWYVDFIEYLKQLYMKRYDERKHVVKIFVEKVKWACNVKKQYKRGDKIINNIDNILIKKSINHIAYIMKKNKGLSFDLKDELGNEMKKRISRKIKNEIQCEINKKLEL